MEKVPTERERERERATAANKNVGTFSRVIVLWSLIGADLNKPSAPPHIKFDSTLANTHAKQSMLRTLVTGQQNLSNRATFAFHTSSQNSEGDCQEPLASRIKTHSGKISRRALAFTHVLKLP